MTVRQSVLDAIGNTPLIRLKGPSEATGCTILGKAEFLNPGQSVKDRAALSIIRNAEKSGQLRPGGVIILETPNPENLSVSSHWFFLDPTHRNPLPPVTLAWLVRERGFVDPRIERLTQARDLNAPPMWPAEQPGAVTVNAVIERLHVAADYSIVARKPHA